MEHKEANVRIEESNKIASIPITGSDKPLINDLIVKKWQKILDVLLTMINVPSSLIMKIDQEHIEVFLKGEGEKNPYENGETAQLGVGLYCETVLGTSNKLLVKNAKNDSVWNHNPDIELNMISYLGFPIKWPDGKFFGTICVLDNKENEYSQNIETLMVSFRDAIEQDLHMLIDHQKVIKLDELKTDFINMISHDLRTPLVSIVGLTKLMLKGEAGKISDKQKEYLTIIHSSVKREEMLINDMLDAAKMESGEFFINKKEANIVEHIKKSLDAVKGIAAEKKITIDIKPSTNSIVVLADGDRIEQVLINLLVNSIKFSPKNSTINIEIMRKNISDIKLPTHLKDKKMYSGDYIYISVRDQGCGIDESELTMIFDKFKQTGNSKMKRKGTGLGLSVSKYIVESHGGFIWADSKEKNVGAVFNVLIPNISSLLKK